ncbi:Vitamin B12-binding protein precursor [Poriferisphaera corsica]|uniref:Vitamin B12-binding protein n=1 Tax=Poriferisphaera corsica TaxID=2528020 RepID=A0A517YT35_9BACT|nr:ABC transporter substrate-binding protein [Poriferisphaera corsica]QDU33322.1 Vitamin B12-binding protein precursor [Poriferisphaera corsica]
MTNTPQKFLPLLLTLTLTFLLSACGEQSAPAQPANRNAPQSTNAAPAPDTNPASNYRIVTLAPTLTEIAFNLGFTDQVVGVGQYDMIASPDTPVLGTFYQIDTEKLLSLKPTHIFMLTGKDGPPADLTKLADQGLFKLFAYSYPETIDDALQLLDSDGTALTNIDTPQNSFTGPDAPGLGQALNKTQLASELKSELYTRLNKIMQLTKNLDKPNTLMIFALAEPVMASGSGSVNDQLLGIAGGTNAAANAAISAPTFDRESLIALAPDAILALLPDVNPQVENDPRLASLTSLPIPAAKNKQIFILNSPTILIPGLTMHQTAASFAQSIHPNLKDQLAPIAQTPLTQPLPESEPANQN